MIFNQKPAKNHNVLPLSSDERERGLPEKTDELQTGTLEKRKIASQSPQYSTVGIFRNMSVFFAVQPSKSGVYYIGPRNQFLEPKNSYFPIIFVGLLRKFNRGKTTRNAQISYVRE